METSYKRLKQQATKDIAKLQSGEVIFELYGSWSDNSQIDFRHYSVRLNFNLFPYTLILYNLRTEKIFNVNLVAGHGSGPNVIVAKNLFAIFQQSQDGMTIQDLQGLAVELAQRFLKIAWNIDPLIIGGSDG